VINDIDCQISISGVFRKGGVRQARIFENVIIVGEPNGGEKVK
jgi:hypothetical protein